MNDRDLHERASALFLELRGAAPAEQERRLCDAAGPLRAEVLSLLHHDDRSDGDAADGTPTRIGPYRVVRRLGHGGSGYVLLADQDEPVRRRVAIKLVPYAATNPDVASRFDFERRALERLEHPNIARILDAGRTTEGMPYLVMEYVRGESITEFCREHGLGLRERIGLVLQVADAVQHAHQRGVIHRDLKPANILVGAVGGGRPSPKVVDFGIAKPIPGAFDGGASMHQTAGGFLGTPAYMAPEQCRAPDGEGGVDTRADVYSLGAVLYELACGRPPVDARGDALDVLRRIREANPPAASQVRGQDSAFRHDPVPRSLLRDLDRVLAKALEKRPAGRYSTVSGLAEDLGRLLRSVPVEAQPPTLGYRAARFVQRNRLLVVSAALISLAVTVGIVGLAAGLIEARRQRLEAIDQSDAQREINKFLTDDLLAAASPEQQGRHITALDLLHRAGRQVDRRFPGRPIIAGAIHHTLGVAYTKLGAYDDAERHLDRAIALRRAAAGVDAGATLRSEIAAASLLGHRERLAEAEAALTDVIARARLTLGADDPALYVAINDLGVIYEAMDRGKDAVALLQEALAGRVRILGAEAPEVLMTTSNLAQAYDRLGQTERSLTMMVEALRIAESLDEPPNMTILGLCNNIGATYQDLRREQEAAPYLRRAADMAARWIGPDDPATLTIQGNLAGLEAKLGDPARAAELYGTVVSAWLRAVGPDAPDTLFARYGYWNSLRLAGRSGDAASGFVELLADVSRALGEEHWLTAQTRTSLGRTLLDAGRAAEALPHARLAAAQFRSLYGAEHARTRTATTLLAEIEARLAAK